MTHRPTRVTAGLPLQKQWDGFNTVHTHYSRCRSSGQELLTRAKDSGRIKGEHRPTVIAQNAKAQITNATANLDLAKWRLQWIEAVLEHYGDVPTILHYAECEVHVDDDTVHVYGGTPPAPVPQKELGEEQ